MRLLAATLLFLLAWPIPWSEAALDPRLGAVLEQLDPGEEISVVVTLADQVALDRFRNNARNLRGLPTASRRQHRQELVTALKDKATATQGALRNLLHERGARHITPLWIFNGLAVTAGRELIEALAIRPEVADVRLNGTLQLPTYTVSPAAAPEWNLSAIHAPELWSRGFTGQGVVVATLDSGVDLLHADLGPQWRGGTNSWFDPYGEHPASPFDNDGHGTAVTGILVGGSAGGTVIGVAPGARWIAARIFNDAGLGQVASIHQGFQWLLDPDGDPATDDSPDVVNNSWGFEDSAGSCVPEFQPDVQVLRAAGIAMAFSAGNGGSLAGTSVSPANYPESFAAGAVDQSLAVPLFSARGPSACDGTTYPEVVAPGVYIKTADLTLGGLLPASYSLVAGTSFAAPHVAGAMALLLSAFPGQPVAMLEAALRQSATDLGPVGPDNSSGAGLVNALAAFTFLDVPMPNLSILPSAGLFNFGTVAVNSSLSQPFIITSGGAVDLLLGGLTVTGANASEFVLTDDGCSGRSLATSASCTFRINFTPLTISKRTATVNIPSNDPDTPLASILLIGNERVRIGTFRKGTWYLDNGSGGWEAGEDTVYAGFGAATDIAVAGDVDGDGVAEVGVYRPATGQWYFDLDHSGTWGGCTSAGGTDLCLPFFGAPADLPVTGDWNGDGRFEVGVYRQGMWYLDNGNGVWDNPDDPTVANPDTVYQSFGAPTDLPVTGDWDGDGRTQIGTYRQGAWYLDNGNGRWDPPSDPNVTSPDTAYSSFGASTDLPVTGDWDGDGRTQIGTYRQGAWYLDNGNGQWDPGLDVVHGSFGASDDAPVTGNWQR